MNVLTTTWRQLVSRRLWPVAILLVVALAAVPMILSKDPAPVPPPEQPAAAPAGGTAKADATLAEPVVAKASAEDRAKRRRVLGVRKDPFTPAAVKKKPKVAAKKSHKKATEQKTEQESTSTPTTSAPSTPVAPTTPVEPAPKKKVYEKGSLIVRFGDATSDELDRMNLKKLAALPNDPEKDPLLIYMGLTDHGKKAVFMVDESLTPTGDGTCKPHPASCETIELAKGETEFFDVIDAETGDTTAQYELDLVDIK
jgi:hypothetical protein